MAILLLSAQVRTGVEARWSPRAGRAAGHSVTLTASSSSCRRISCAFCHPLANGTRHTDPTRGRRLADHSPLEPAGAERSRGSQTVGSASVGTSPMSCSIRSRQATAAPAISARSSGSKGKVSTQARICRSAMRASRKPAANASRSASEPPRAVATSASATACVSWSPSPGSRSRSSFRSASALGPSGTSPAQATQHAAAHGGVDECLIGNNLPLQSNPRFPGEPPHIVSPVFVGTNQARVDYCAIASALTGRACGILSKHQRKCK
jgi:hypothetical protein